MTFRHLEAFAQIAARGGFTRAAEVLYLTQSTVSGQVRELEQELGAPLFRREGREVGLTEAGRLLLPFAREVLDARERLREAAAGYRGLRLGELVVHASTTPGEYLLPSVLARFKAAHPEIGLRLRVSDSSEVYAKLASGEASLGLVGEPRDDEDLECDPFGADRIELFAASGAAPAAALTLTSLVREPLVLREPGSATQRVVDAALAAAGVPHTALRVVAELGSATAVKEAVKAGVGAGFLSSLAVNLERGSGVLRTVPVEGLEPIERRFYAVRRRRRRPSPAEEAFLQMLLPPSPFVAPE